MHRVFCIAIGALLLLLCGCAKPEFWVKGLTLPPGSKVEEKSETTNVGEGSTPGNGGAGKVLRVTFECPGGFDKVAAHIGQGLKAQGFTEVADGMGSLSGIDMKGFDKFLKSMKTYEHAGKAHSVTLQSMGGMLAGMDLSKFGNDSKMMDTYVLMVMTDK